MPTPGERRSLIFIAAIAALGVAARGWKELKSDSAGGVQSGRSELARQIEAVDSAITSGGAKRKGRKKAVPPAAKDSAPAAADARASRRPSLGILRVEQLPQPERDPREGYRRRMEAIDSARAESVRRQSQLSRSSVLPAPPSRSPRAVKQRAATVDMDVASAAEIEALPFVGAALADRIVADRDARGPFGSLDGLTRVRGVGPSIAAKLAPHVTFSLPSRLGDAGETRRRPKSGRRRGG
jgi:predicted flap endonuclease-1-like 5' DNA nuclease